MTTDFLAVSIALAILRPIPPQHGADRRARFRFNRSGDSSADSTAFLQKGVYGRFNRSGDSSADSTQIKTSLRPIKVSIALAILRPIPQRNAMRLTCG